MSLKNCRSTLEGSFVMSPAIPDRVGNSWDPRLPHGGHPSRRDAPPPRGRGKGAEPAACGASPAAVGTVLSGRAG